MKKILALILAVAMLMSMSVCLISCNDDNGDNNNNGGSEGEGNQNTETKVTYTVNVTDADGNPVKNVEITFTTDDGLSVPFSTDITGRAARSTAKGLTAAVTKLPAGYEYDKLNEEIVFDANGNATIVITKVEAQGDPYIIKVVDEDGNPIAGVTVQMCSDFCRPPVTTGEDGTATYTYLEGEWHAQLTVNIPDDATADEVAAILAETIPGYTVADPKAYYDFEDNIATITLTKLAD